MGLDATTIPLLTSLPEAARRVLATQFAPRNLDIGDYVFFEEDRAAVLYVVGTGKVKILRHSDTGKELILEILSPGSVFGTTGVLGDGTYAVAAQAMEPSAVWGIQRGDLLRALERYPELALAVARSLAAELRQAWDVMQSLALERVERRIARVLLRLASATGERTDEGIVIGVALTRQDVADMSATTVETTIRVMSRLSKQGIIQSRRGRVTLVEPHKLVLIAEEL